MYSLIGTGKILNRDIQFSHMYMRGSSRKYESNFMNENVKLDENTQRNYKKQNEAKEEMLNKKR